MLGVRNRRNDVRNQPKAQTRLAKLAKRRETCKLPPVTLKHESSIPARPLLGRQQ